jgi:7-cyano-7-deazaguanine reductase
MATSLDKSIGTKAPLGQKSAHPQHYDAGLLFPVSRETQRRAMNFPKLEFYGSDIWNAYELCWLNEKGKAVRAYASFEVSANSPFLAESKSVKLYLNSFNNERFSSINSVKEIIENDISQICEAPVKVNLFDSCLEKISPLNSSSSVCIDELDVEISHYERNPALLQHSRNLVNEKLVSHLFRSLCLVTGQPDWGSIYIEYNGYEIKRESLLSYLLSYYNHKGFAENCIEQIFIDLKSRINPKSLVVYGRFTRRGGIDINPYRSDSPYEAINKRLIFQ